MKILHVVQSLAKAGAERSVVNICNQLVKNKLDEVVIFMAINDTNEYVSILDTRIKVVSGRTNYHFSLFSKNDVKNDSYISFVNEFQPDIIHSHLYFADLVAHSYTNNKAVFVSHLQNSEIKEYNGFVLADIAKKKMWTNLNEYVWLRKRYKKHRTNFVACSKGALLLHKNKIGIGETLLLPNASPLPELSYDFKKLNEKLQLIWIGRFTTVKRPLLALEIAKLLKSRKIEFTLKMAGDGAEIETTRKAIIENQLEDCVELLGLVDDLSGIYENADLMIHTSVYEGLPLVFTEALSYGTPIISTNCMPDNEIIVDEINGRIIDSENPADFEKAILEITENPEIYSQLSRNAIQSSKKFGIISSVENLMAFYEKLLAPKK